MRLIKPSLAAWRRDMREQAVRNGWRVTFERYDDDLSVIALFFTGDGSRYLQSALYRGDDAAEFAPDPEQVR